MRPKLSLDILENRETPAGVVTVTLAGGSLSMLGDGNAFGNQVRLVETAQNVYDIVGEGGTFLRMGNGPIVAAINDVTLTRNITAKFGGGPDEFTYDGNFGAKIGDMKLTMGAGNDKVTIEEVFAQNLQINQGIPFFGAPDDDFITVRSGGPNFQGGFRGGVVLNNGSGSDTVDLQIGTVFGLDVNNKSGGDKVTLTNSSIGRGINLTNSVALAAGNTITINSVTAGRGLVVQNPGNFKMDTTIANVVLGGGVSVTNGSIDPTATNTRLLNSTLGGGVSITGGNGWDYVLLVDVEARQGLAINSGDGFNVMESDSLKFGGGVTYLGRNANDQVTFYGPVQFGRGARFGMGAGDNILSFEGAVGAGIEIAGPLSASFGNGFDQFNAKFLNVGGPTLIGLGGGANFTTITREAFFGGNVSILGGPQDDSIFINADAGRRISLSRNLIMNFGQGFDSLFLGTAGGDVVLHGQLILDAPNLENPNIGPFFRRSGI